MIYKYQFAIKVTAYLTILLFILILFPSPTGSENIIIFEQNIDECHRTKIPTQPTQLFTYTRTDQQSMTPPEVTNDSVVYAIICPANLTSSIQALAAWKTQKGVPTKIFNLDGPEGIYSKIPDGDNASKIHQFMGALLENNSHLRWLLLFGDEDIIPSRQIFVNASELYGLDDYYYSDHYYAGYNNSWDQDNDGIYGEQKGDVNWPADLYVGRLPVNNISEANIVVNKILKYEKSPELGTWMQNFSLWAGLLDGPNNLTAYQSYKDNAMKVTNKIIPMIPKTMDINVLYDYNQTEPGNYSYSSDILDHSSAKSNFYAGNAIVSFAGQAYYTGDELAHYIDVTGLSAAPEGFGSLFSYNDARFATNGNKLPLVYLSTCSVNFSETDDSNMEQLLTSSTGGAIGLVANSGKSYRGETEEGPSYGNWWLCEHYWQLFFNGTVQPGKCLYEVKERYVREVIQPGVPYIQMAVANLVGYNYLGDPELSIWTNIPQELDFQYSIVRNEGYKLQIEVKNSKDIPINNSLVCVYNSNNYEYTRTNETGTAVLDLDPRSTGELKITITAHNYLPLVSNFTYINKPPRFGIINDVLLNEDEVKEDYINLKLYVEDTDTLFEDLVFTILNVTDSNVNVRIDKDSNIDIIPYLNWYGESRVTLMVSDGIDAEEVQFQVTVKPVNDPPEITEAIENQELKVGESFRYQVITSDIDNDKLTFYDDTKLFNIDKNTGKIKYTAKEEDVGKHTVSIYASDGNTSAKMTFEIEVIQETNFLDLYWFPIIVIVTTIILIVLIKLYAVTHTHTEKKDKEKEKMVKKKKK